jgi:hypothetical protein
MYLSFSFILSPSKPLDNPIIDREYWIPYDRFGASRKHGRMERM